MEKQFWVSIKENNFALPAGYSVSDLTEELFSFIGSTDPELRDTIGLEAFYHWLKQGLYSVDDLSSFIARLCTNLQTGIGKTESDSVFLRSFSALWLGLIVDYDNEKPSLGKEKVVSILKAALVYFAAENDLRGYIATKGWAHAIAHTLDLFTTLAKSPHTDANDHLDILNGIANKLKNSPQWIYLYNEDSRIARTVTNIFKRDTLNKKQIKDWLGFLSRDWNGAWQSEESTRAYFNGRNFLRALYLNILIQKGDEIPHKEPTLKLVQDTWEQAKPWEW